MENIRNTHDIFIVSIYNNYLKLRDGLKLGHYVAMTNLGFTQEKFNKIEEEYNQIKYKRHDKRS